MNCATAGQGGGGALQPPEGTELEPANAEGTSQGARTKPISEMAKSGMAEGWKSFTVGMSRIGGKLGGLLLSHRPGGTAISPDDVALLPGNSAMPKKAIST